MSRKKDNYENSLWLKFKKWIDGETDLLADGMEIRVPEKDSKVLSQAAQSAQVELTGYDPAKAARMRKKEEHGLLLFHRFYQVMSVLLCLTIIFVLLWTIAYLPVFGNAGNPDNNEVSARYIEKGVEETGAQAHFCKMISFFGSKSRSLASSSRLRVCASRLTASIRSSARTQQEAINSTHDSPNVSKARYWDRV